MKKEIYKLDIEVRSHEAFGTTRPRVQVKVASKWQILDCEVDTMFEELGLLKDTSKKTLVISNNKQLLRQDVEILTLIQRMGYDDHYHVDGSDYTIFICDLLLKFFKEYPYKMHVQLI